MSEDLKKVLEQKRWDNEIDFDLGNVNSDVLGDLYKYLIAQFAAQKAKNCVGDSAGSRTALGRPGAKKKSSKVQVTPYD